MSSNVSRCAPNKRRKSRENLWNFSGNVMSTVELMNIHVFLKSKWFWGWCGCVWDANKANGDSSFLKRMEILLSFIYTQSMAVEQFTTHREFNISIFAIWAIHVCMSVHTFGWWRRSGYMRGFLIKKGYNKRFVYICYPLFLSLAYTFLANNMGLPSYNVEIMSLCHTISDLYESSGWNPKWMMKKVLRFHMR